MAKVDWKSESFEPKRLQLDTQNPRIEVDSTATQDEIRVKLRLVMGCDIYQLVTSP